MMHAAAFVTLPRRSANLRCASFIAVLDYVHTLQAMLKAFRGRSVALQAVRRHTSGRGCLHLSWTRMLLTCLCSLVKIINDRLLPLTQR